MTTYIAWDGNEYPLPTPEGWYLGSDDRWWPDGHGPGPKMVAPPSTVAPSAPPPPGMPSAPPPPQSMAPPDTIYSAPPPGSPADPFMVAEAAPTSSGNRSRAVLIGVALVALLAIGVGAAVALTSDDDEGTEAVATTVFQTQADDVTEGSDTTTGESGDASDTPDTPDTTVAVADGKGSIDDPYAIGETLVIAYDDFESGERRTWNVVVLEPIRDITDAVAEENQFNDPPEEGSRFMGVPIQVTYASGPVPASLFELTFKAVGPSGVVLATFDPSCGVIPDELDTFAELFEGGTVEGNVCWSVPSGDIGDLTMIVEVFLDDTTVYADLDG